MGFGGATFTYNHRGRMASANNGGVTATYTCNALGQRIRRVAAGVTTLYVYDEAGHLAGEYTGAGDLIQETVWLGDTPVATLRPDGSGGVALYYVHADHLNTPRLVTDTANNIRWRWESDPFGTTAPEENPASLGTFVYHLRFPGQQYDDVVGLHYNYLRDYDPAVGRYVESDPIGLGGGTNTYVYADAAPTASTDPTGEFAQFGVWAWRGYQAYRASRAAKAAVNTAGAAAAAAVAADGLDKAQERQAEHDAYKAVCRQQPPSGLDPCSLARWKRNRNKQCMDMRQAWDDKWMPGRHADDISQLRRAIEKLDEWITKNCC